MKTDGVIFDVDDTLQDAAQRTTEVYTVILKREKTKGKVITADMLTSVMGPLNEDITAKLFPELSYEKRMRLIETCYEFECKYLRKRGDRLYPHVEDTLEKLSARHPLYIVSDCQDGYIEVVLAVHDLQKYFRNYKCSGRTGKAKFEDLKSVVERNHLQQPVYIGDTKIDQISCCKTGIPFIYASFRFDEVDDYAAGVDIFSKLAQPFLIEQQHYGTDTEEMEGTP